MPPVDFETTISEGERPQTYALDRAATGTGSPNMLENEFYTDKNSTIHTIPNSRCTAPLPGTTDELANIHSYVSPTNSKLRDKHHTTSAQGTSRDVTPRPE